MPNNSGNRLPKGQAKKQYDDFLKKFKDKELQTSVVYTLSGLQKYLQECEAMLTAAGVPANEQGIALNLGINTGTKTHTKNKVTVMLVASQFTADDVTGKVTSINNAVIGSQSVTALSATANTIDDDAFDDGSLWP